MQTPRLGAGLAIAVSFLLGACSAAPPRLPKTIVLISIEELRPDLLALYGGSIAAPALGEIASRGVVFEDAATASPMARPALASLLTGEGPDRLLVRDNASDRLPAAARTVAERMREARFRTAAFVGSPFASYGSGLDRGFDLFDAPDTVSIGPARYFPPMRPAADLASHAAQWVAGLSASDTAFAWIHFGDLHGYAALLPPNKARDKLAEEIGRIDTAIATVRAALGASGRTPGAEIVVVGTQGSMLGERGARGDAFWLTRETLGIPLVWSAPDIRGLGTPGSRSRARAWIPDVAATLGAEVGRPVSLGADGRDLRGGADALAGRVRRAWTWAPDDQFAWPPLSAVLEDATWKAAGGERPAAARGGAGIAAPPDDEANRMIQAVNGVRLAIATGQRQGALATLDELLTRWPDCLAILQSRVFLDIGAGRAGDAERAAERMVRLYPGHVEAIHWAAHAAKLAGNKPRAAELLARALSLSPSDPDILYDLACERALAGDRDGAFLRLEEAMDAGFRNGKWVEQDPDLAALRPDPRFAALLRARGR